MTKFEQGRRVVVNGRLGEVMTADESTVRVSPDWGMTQNYAPENVKKWPIMDIPHPLPVGAVVVVVPPDYSVGWKGEVRFTGTDGDGLIYRLDGYDLENLIEVRPAAILEVKEMPDPSPIHGP